MTGWRLAHAALVLTCVGILVSPALACAVESQPPVAVSPNAPSSTDLVERPKTWNGQPIPFEGEAIGEAMVRGDYAWLHLNDDAYYLKNVEEGAPLGGYNAGMPVYLPTELARKVRVFGDYHHEGDVVKVEGIFNAACGEHGGDTDIHATSLDVVIPGRRAIDRVPAWKITLAVGLVLLALVLWQAERRSTLSLARGAVTRARAMR